MRYNLLILFLTSFIVVSAQEKIYTTKNAHSHNDYEQQQPFHLAYQENFGSIEADIHLVNGSLYVAHDKVNIKEDRTLALLYLDPIKAQINAIGTLQLLIDIKTDALSTLAALISVLQNYPEIIQSSKIKIVISGNRPEPEQWNTYPDFILFDGRLDQNYTEQQLKKVGLISDSYFSFIGRKKPWPLEQSDKDKIVAAANKVHQLGKPFRIWAHPDFPEAWAEIMSMGIDYINTDKVENLSDFMVSRNKQLTQLPYNRIINSAGKVIRYGKPDLENHALDVTKIANSNLVAVMERYGMFVINPDTQEIVNHIRFTESKTLGRYLSTYSGIKSFKYNNKVYIVWSAAEREGGKAALIAVEWSNKIENIIEIPLQAELPAPNAIPNDIAVVQNDQETFLYVVLNGNNKLVKIDWNTKNIIWSTTTGVAPYGVTIANGKIFVTNWAGRKAEDSTKERAGVPWGLAYTDPKTGATSSGSVSVYNQQDGTYIKDIEVGLHPNAVLKSENEKFIYVANGSSDDVSVINTKTLSLVEAIHVGMHPLQRGLQGSTPNGLALNSKNDVLYVSNGLDNAIAWVELGKNAGSKSGQKSKVLGLIPTEAYPAGLIDHNNHLIVANLESQGANVIDEKKKARSIHHELASLSIIPLPDSKQLVEYTTNVAQYNLVNRVDLLALQPRKNIEPVPVPERLGEPSVFKHVVYIIKENKTYDQVFGDMKEGNGDSSLCVFGEKITPNTHTLAKQFGLMDNYYASGKSSAEGHQWTDAGMVSDYVEKNVRAWFRSYPHRQADALVYNKAGFIWNHALDHGKTVKVFGEACETVYDNKLNWFDLYNNYTAGVAPNWYNTTTIARMRPIISAQFPDCDNMVFSDQQRAAIFINEWKQYEKGDSLPSLMILSLPNDHTAGTSPDFPTPDAMVADNDLAVGKIVDFISKSKYWDSTVIFITQDDSQSGWDHVSAYRTVGLVVSPYSSGKLVNTQFNQVSMLRTIEQILGIPPMNVVDATSRLMTECFQPTKRNINFTYLPNTVPLNKMNKPLHALVGKEKKYAEMSQKEVFNEVDGGKDDTMNKIIWYYLKGDNPYPTNTKLK